ncbi:hypothetical protein WA577_007512 [Blastocystis sp. JDR]
MLSLLDKDKLIQMLLKSFHPGDATFDEFINAASADKTFTKLFAFDMSFNVTEAMLKDAFSPFGNIVDLKVLMHEGSNKPKGCGFIVYDNPLSVLKAFQHAIVIDGRPVQMKYAAAQDNAPHFRKDEAPKAQEEKVPKDARKIHVSGFPLTWTNEDVEQFFSQYGPLEEAFICYEKGTRKSRGFGFVTFVNKKDFDKCLETPRKQGDGFEVVCAKVSLTVSDDRHKRSRYDDRRDDRRDDRKYGRREERRYDRRDERRYDSRDDHRSYLPPPEYDPSRDYSYRPDKRPNFDNYGYGATQNYTQYAPPYNAYPPAEYPPPQPVYASPYNYPLPTPANNAVSTPPSQQDLHTQYTYPPAY